MFKIFLIIVLATSSFSGSNTQIDSWYFADYDFYFRPSGRCGEKVTRTIHGYQYLKLKVYSDCKSVEVSCYNSKNNNLKEKGVYYNTGKIITREAMARDISFDSSKIVQKRYIEFKRVGTWRFYDKNGKLIKTKVYKG